MPPADVAAVVGDEQVLVPGQLRRGAAGLLHRARVVERGEADERLHLAAPDRVAARVGATAGGRLHRPVDGSAEAALDGLRARDLEGLVAAAHLAGLALVAVALLAGELLDVEVVVVAEAARDAPGDAAVVAGRDDRDARAGDAAHVQAGRVDLVLDEQLGEREAQLRRREQRRGAAGAAQREVEGAAARGQPAGDVRERRRRLRRLEALEELLGRLVALLLVGAAAAGLGREAPARGGHGGRPDRAGAAAGSGRSAWRRARAARASCRARGRRRRAPCGRAGRRSRRSRAPSTARA